MAISDTRVHGSIFFLLRKFIVQSYSDEIWNELNNNANTLGEYEITKSYELNEINSIVKAASVKTGFSPHELQLKFGEYLVPDLFSLYSSYVNPAWRTMEIIEHTEQVMHGAVRKLNSTANPPVLHVSRMNENLLMVDYYSKRKMGSLAVGIIRGIAKYYNEDDRIEVTALSDPDDDRVQIRIRKH
jgi:hypothetical protein